MHVDKPEPAFAGINSLADADPSAEPRKPRREHKPSRRAIHLWARLGSFYGVPRMTDAYGDLPPPEWCEVVDAATNEAVRLTLAELRATSAIHPPTLPQFEGLVRKHSQRYASKGPSIIDRLHEAARRACTSHEQRCAHWTFLYDGDPHAKSEDFRIVGIAVPRVGDAPGFRIAADDLAVQEAA